MTTFTKELSSILVLNQQEREYLDKYGPWLERLESGDIFPSTDPQRQFLQVVRGELQPDAPHEHLWLRLREHKKAISRLKLDRYHAIGNLSNQEALVEQLQSELALLKADLVRHSEWLKESHKTISQLEAKLGITSEGNARDPIDVYATSGGNDWREQK